MSTLAAQHGSKAVLPVGWKKYTLWQYTDGEIGPKLHNVSQYRPMRSQPIQWHSSSPAQPVAFKLIHSTR
jgi:hypothetical protein